MEFHINTSPSPESYYNNGRQFCEAAWRSFGGRDGKVAENGIILCLPVPTVVNAAFSCEMHFKALLLLERKAFPKGKEGHNLKSLFSRLEVETQERIGAFCLPKSLPSPLEAFIAILESHKQDFADTRYYMEHSGWQEMSPITMLTISENLTTITGVLIKENNEVLEGK